MGHLEFLHMDKKSGFFMTLSVQESWLNVEMILERTKWTTSEDGLLVPVFPSTLTRYSSAAFGFHNENLAIETVLI